MAKTQAKQGVTCTNPVLIDGQGARCRKCPGCLRQAARYWVTACVAESVTAVETWTLTLTYRPGETGSDVLKYSDVQRAFKRLRKAGYQFRYVVAGELGAKKGRPHWHAILFWSTKPPDRGSVIGYSDGGKYERRDWHFWKHGHTVIDPAFSALAVRYVVKYLKKAEGSAGYFACSRHPGVGQAYFDDLADRQGANRAPTPVNEFRIVSGNQQWTGPISPNRWLRYRKRCAAAYAAAGPLRPLIPFKQYENIMSDEERSAFQLARDETWFAQRNVPRPRDIELHHVSNGNRLWTYQLFPERWLRLTLDGSGLPLRWLVGEFHTAGGFVRLRDLRSRPVARSIDVLISQRQFGELLWRVPVTPSDDPSEESDFITTRVAKIRRRDGVSSIGGLCSPRQASAAHFDVEQVKFSTDRVRDAYALSLPPGAQLPPGALVGS